MALPAETVSPWATAQSVVMAPHWVTAQSVVMAPPWVMVQWAVNESLETPEAPA